MGPGEGGRTAPHSGCGRTYKRKSPVPVNQHFWLILLQVGKSSLVNSLLRKPILPTYKLSSSSVGPTTTTLPQEVTLDVSGKRIRFIDTPGLSWNTPEPTDECPGDINQIRARDILLRNKGRIDRLKDPTLAGLFSPHLPNQTILIVRNLSSCSHRLTI